MHRITNRVKSMAAILITAMLVLAACGGGGGGSAPVVTLQSITVTPAIPIIEPSATRQFTATGIYSNATTQDITTSVIWSSNTPTTASIHSSTGIATGVALGDARITATSGTISGNTTVSVATLSTIAVTAVSPNISITAVKQFTATGAYSNSGTQNITAFVTWSSGTPANATISTGGLAKGVAWGTSIIQAASGAISGSATLTVSQPAGSFSISSVTDPLAPQQWHLKNTGQNAYSDTTGTSGMDINVEPIYINLAFKGAGVTVAVVDSGLEIAHEDLASNVVPEGSWNFINSTTNSTNTTSTTGDHGTSVSGLIAMSNNSVGGIGVAPGASLKGFNFLSSSQITAFQVAALGGSSASPISSDVAVFNQSYGTTNTASVPMNSIVEAQYLYGVTTLRSGKGALYVKSAGNGFTGFISSTSEIAAVCGDANTLGTSCQNANFDPSNTLPYNIVVGAIRATGVKSSYSTTGSALWVSAPGGEFGRNASLVSGLSANNYDPAMVTTDQSDCTKGYSKASGNTSTFNNGGAPNTDCNYANTMNGTSSAAPVTSGVIALMLNANPALTWRDVKHILATTSREIDATIAPKTVLLSNGTYTAEQGWVTNKAPGLHKFHNWYGFGMVNAYAAVAAANAYVAGSLGTFGNSGWISSGSISLAIPDNSTTGTSGTGSALTVPARTVEAVQIKVNITHTYTRELGIELTSPLGTKSILKNIRDGFGGTANLSNMVLASNAFYGEAAAGTWTIKVIDGVAQDLGTLTNWQIRVYGH